jgi:hypothetical protein
MQNNPAEIELNRRKDLLHEYINTISTFRNVNDPNVKVYIEVCIKFCDELISSKRRLNKGLYKSIRNDAENLFEQIEIIRRRYINSVYSGRLTELSTKIQKIKKKNLNFIFILPILFLLIASFLPFTIKSGYSLI